MASPSLNIGRHSVLGAVYVVTTVTVLRRPVFADTAAAQMMQSTLRTSDAVGDTESLAWVVMPDHVHWLFELRADILSRVVQRVKSQSAREINAVCASRGALWQPGFYDRQVRRHQDLMTHTRFILENPIRCSLAGQLGKYPHAWCRDGINL